MGGKHLSQMSDSEKLDHIIQLHGDLKGKVERMESGLLGDEFDRGLVKKFEQHEKQDEQRHVDMGGQISQIRTGFGEAKSYVRGAMLIIAALVVIVNIIIAFVK